MPIMNPRKWPHLDNKLWIPCLLTTIFFSLKAKKNRVWTTEGSKWSDCISSHKWSDNSDSIWLFGNHPACPKNSTSCRAWCRLGLNQPVILFSYTLKALFSALRKLPVAMVCLFLGWFYWCLNIRPLQVPPDLQNEVLVSLLQTDPDVVDYLLRRKASQSSWVCQVLQLPGDFSFHFWTVRKVYITPHRVIWSGIFGNWHSWSVHLTRNRFGLTDPLIELGTALQDFFFFIFIFGFY